MAVSHTPVILDDLNRGLGFSLIGMTVLKGILIADQMLFRKVFAKHPEISFVLHCAAKIVVPESVKEPLQYYGNSLAKTFVLLEEMKAAGFMRFFEFNRLYVR